VITEEDEVKERLMPQLKQMRSQEQHFTLSKSDLKTTKVLSASEKHIELPPLKQATLPLPAQKLQREESLSSSQITYEFSNNPSRAQQEIEAIN